LWRDKSGNDRDANQSDPNAAFNYRVGTPSTMPGLVLDGSNDYMEILDANMSAAHIFAVATLIPGGAGSAILLSRKDAKLSIRRYNLDAKISSGGVEDFSFNDGETRVDGASTLNFSYNTYHVLSVRKGSQSPSNSYDVLELGVNSAYPNRHWKGEIVEILIYDRALSTEEIDRIQAYLGEKWGVTIDSQ